VRSLHSDDGAQRIGRAREHDEEPVARGADLTPIVLSDCVAHDPAMLVKDIREVVPEALE
jgi:hypothetical protein